MSVPIPTTTTDLRSSGWLTTAPKHRPGFILTIISTLALLSLFSLSVFIAPRSPDYFWSIALGHWISAHSLFTTGALSYTLPHHVIATEWLYDFLLYHVYAAFGTTGTDALLVVFTLAAFSATFWYLTHLTSHLRALCAGLATSALLMAFIPQGRAMSLSFIYVPLLLTLVHVGRTKPRVLLALPALFVLWVNTHASVTLGLGLLGLELLWALGPPSRLVSFTGRNPRRLFVFLAFVSSLLATFITPWGPALVYDDLKFTNNPVINTLITEWHSPNFHNIIYLGLAACVVAILCASVRVPRPAVETSAAAFLFLAWLHATRSLPYLAIVVAALAASTLPQLHARHALRLVAFVSGASISLLASLTYALPHVTSPALAPKAANSYLNYHHVTSRVLTTYAWSGYELFSGRQSFVDGRTYLFANNHLLQTYENLANQESSPNRVLAKYHVRYVLWPAPSPLAHYLSTDSSWTLVYHHKGVDLFSYTSPVRLTWPSGRITY